ncbi:CcmD family protein [Chryseolinea soli]|uniref:CcmD family protein n=1 Tax=Chryseolinea soli TaxID=2321403 RepID=UPI00135ABFE0|nr:CcmD family protein [Chryseolinea soli]
MKYSKLILFFVLALSCYQSFCQAEASVEMADTLRSNGKIYTVVIGLVVILTGVVLFLLRVDKKVRDLGKK